MSLKRVSRKAEDHVQELLSPASAKLLPPHCEMGLTIKSLHSDLLNGTSYKCKVPLVLSLA